MSLYCRYEQTAFLFCYLAPPNTHMKVGTGCDGCQSYNAAVLRDKSSDETQMGTWELVTVLWRSGVQVTLQYARMGTNKLSSLLQKY